MTIMASTMMEEAADYHSYPAAFALHALILASNLQVHCGVTSFEQHTGGAEC